MPEMNGQELAIAMRQVWPRAPIIMLSGTPDIPEQALKVVDTFVAKDCLVSKLLPAISLLKKEHSLNAGSQTSAAIGTD
jgi:FixJ family two-component response regulator